MLMEPVLTTNQELVFQALQKSGSPLSAYAILDRLQGNGIRAPLQVYRALEKLIGYGLVHRLESLNAFVVCAHHGEHAQHPLAFAICDGCGLVAEFMEPSVEESLNRWSHGHAFHLKRVTVELRGLCKSCDGDAK